MVRFWLTVAGLLFAIESGGVFSLAESVVHQIYAAILALAATVSLCTATVVGTLKGIAKQERSPTSNPSPSPSMQVFDALVISFGIVVVFAMFLYTCNRVSELKKSNQQRPSILRYMED